MSALACVNLILVVMLVPVLIVAGVVMRKRYLLSLALARYFLIPDINECSSNPCQNGAQCVDAVNMYTCNCVPGYEGTHCETGKIEHWTYMGN